MPVMLLPDDRNGDFIIGLQKPNEVSQEDENMTINHTITFHGQKLSHFQLFRRLGNLPDNNILTNTLINSLGKNLLSLYKHMEAISHDKDISMSRKNEQLFYLELESESNSFHISVFEALASLEMSRTNDSNNTCTIGSERVLIEQLYNARSAYLDERDQLTNDPVHHSRIAKQRAIIEKNKESMLTLLDKSGPNLQTLYRKVLDDFAEEQRNISIYQHRADRPLDYANRSLTEAYQNASYAMEKHIFSMEKPTKGQLWILEDGQVNSDIMIDTRRYPSMKKEDALYSACIIESPLELELNQELELDPDWDVILPKDEADTAIELMSEEESVLNIESMSPGTLFAIKKNSIQKNSKLNREQDNSLAIRQNDAETAKSRKTIKNAKPSTEQVLSFFNGMKRINVEKADALSLKEEAPLHLFHSKDIFSAVGFACVDFTKYFESEMAAKKPVMTTAMFVAMAATFGSAGLATAGMHSAQGLSAVISKILSFGGKLGISPEQMHAAINAISNTWLELTYSKGSLMHILIMNGFGLPKINYTIFDTLFNHSENRDTLTLFAERFSSQDLAGYTDKEKQEQLIHNIFMVAAMLGGAIAVGLSADVLVHTGGVWAHIGTGVETLIDVPFEAFSNLAAHSVSAEILAIIALAFTVKSAGLFLGKVFLVLSHMKEEVTEEQRAAALFMGTIKEGIDNGEFDAAKLEHLKENATFLFYRTHFEDLIEKEPKLEQVFDVTFLNQMGVTKTEMTLAQKAANGVVAVGATLKEYLIDKTMIPLGKIILSPLALIGLGTLWGKNYLLGTIAREGLSILAGFVTSLGLMITAGVKTLSIALYGSIQRLVMAMSDVAFSATAFINYSFSSPINALKAIPLALAKSVITTLAIINPILNFAVTVVKYPIALVTGSVGGLIGGLASMGAWISDKIFGTNSFDATWTATKAIMRAPITAGDLYSEYVFKKSQNFLANTVHRIDKEVYGVRGGATILDANDVVTGGIARAFDWLKIQGGTISYAVRNLVVRNQERLDQAFRHQEYISTQAADATVEYSVNDSVKALGAMRASGPVVRKSLVGVYADLDDDTPALTHGPSIVTSDADAMNVTSKAAEQGSMDKDSSEAPSITVINSIN